MTEGWEAPEKVSRCLKGTASLTVKTEREEKKEEEPTTRGNQK